MTIKARTRWIWGYLLVLVPLVLWGAEGVQRQVLSTSGAVMSGSGQRLETTIGQAISSKLDGSNSVYPGYLNTNHSPGTVTDLLAVTGIGEGEANLTWTAPGADGLVGNASSVIVKVSTNPITTQALFEAAQTYSVLTPLPSGGFESQVSTGLPPGPDYYFAVEARDAAKNQGALSNLVSTQTFAVPPADITTLAAVTGGDAGSATLSWNSPGDDANVGNLNPGQYRIDYSTDPGHLFTFTQYQVLLATIASPGTGQTYPVAGLLGNSTYYFSVFTGDEIPAFSGPSNIAQTLTRAYPPAAAAYSAVSSQTFTANWSLNNNQSGTEFFIEIADNPGFAPVLSSQGWTTALSAVFSGLQTNRTYYARVKARNAALVETVFTDLGSVQLSPALAPPLGLAVTSADRTLLLTWNPVLSGDPTGVRIYRSSASSGVFDPLATVAIGISQYQDSGLLNGTSYFYRLSSFNDGAESALSGAVAGIPRDGLAPQGVAGITGTAADGVFVLRWESTLYNTDGTALEDLAGYRVYRTASLEQTPVLLGLISSSGEPVFLDPTAGTTAPQFYFIRALDSSGNESIDSPWAFNAGFRAADQAGVTRFDYFWVSPDRRAYLQVPNQAANALARDRIVVTWKRHPEEENGRVAASYEVLPVSAVSGKSPARFVFPSPRTRLSFRYTPPPPAAPGLASNTVFSPNDLSVFFHNGVEFVKLGGAVDQLNNTITVSSRLAGKYVIKQSLRAGSFTLVQTAPTKIFTPNSDGVNDLFQIFFENPKDSVISIAKVYDITGAEVSDLKLGLTGNSLVWDGRSRDGATARGGVYIYQIQSEGKTWNGTMVLAK